MVDVDDAQPAVRRAAAPTRYHQEVWKGGEFLPVPAGPLARTDDGARRDLFWRCGRSAAGLCLQTLFLRRVGGGQVGAGFETISARSQTAMNTRTVELARRHRSAATPCCLTALPGAGVDRDGATSAGRRRVGACPGTLRDRPTMPAMPRAAELRPGQRNRPGAAARRGAPPQPQRLSVRAGAFLPDAVDADCAEAALRAHGFRVVVWEDGRGDSPRASGGPGAPPVVVS